MCSETAFNGFGLQKDRFASKYIILAREADVMMNTKPAAWSETLHNQRVDEVMT
jgi:hypothetical protein